MSEPTVSGPQFRADRPAEQEAVRTTIVGGRPPGSGQPVGAIPRGIEVLVKKAAVDPEFKTQLLAERAAAAERIALALDPAEAIMLSAVPAAQLETIIAQTTVPQEHRRTFLGHAAAAMLAALGIAAPGCEPAIKGIRPEPKKGMAPDRPPTAGGARPDPEPVPIPRPERLEPTKGVRPDLPETKSEQP